MSPGWEFLPRDRSESGEKLRQQMEELQKQFVRLSQLPWAVVIHDSITLPCDSLISSRERNEAMAKKGKSPEPEKPKIFSDELMDELSNLLDRLVADRDASLYPAAERGNYIAEAMMARDSDVSLEEFVSWIEMCLPD